MQLNPQNINAPSPILVCVVEFEPYKWENFYSDRPNIIDTYRHFDFQEFNYHTLPASVKRAVDEGCYAADFPSVRNGRFLVSINETWAAIVAVDSKSEERSKRRTQISPWDRFLYIIFLLSILAIVVGFIGIILFGSLFVCFFIGLCVFGILGGDEIFRHHGMIR